MCKTNLIQLYVDETQVPKSGPWSRFSDCMGYSMLHHVFTITYFQTDFKANTVN